VNDVRNIVFDHHGVLSGPRLAEGASPAAVIRALSARGYQPWFVTNSSTLGPPRLAAVLRELSIDADPARCACAGTALAHVLRDEYASSRVLLIGQEGFRDEVSRVCGSCIAWTFAGDDADVVIVGRAPALGGADIEQAARAARRGAPLLAASLDRQFFDGVTVAPGPYDTVMAIARAMDRKPRVVGKPDAFVLTRVLGLAPEDLARTLVVGDEPELDVAFGRRAGARTALLAPAAHPELPPDVLLRRLDELLTICRGPS
jgi:4-nitrophenyl phosphatase